MHESLASESSANAGTQEQIQEIVERVDDINEKMYEFEANKRNNLIFYGIQAEPRETPSMLLNKVNRRSLVPNRGYRNYSVSSNF